MISCELHKNLIEKEVFKKTDDGKFVFNSKAVFDKEMEDLLFSFGLLNICQSLRMNCNGSADDLTDLEIFYLYVYLFHRIQRWTISNSKYDTAVLKLIICTTEEVEESNRYQKYIKPNILPDTP